MKHIGYFFIVKAQIVLSKLDIDMLMSVGSRHYDGHCQSSTMQGGFIYGWTNCLAFGEKKDELEVSISSGEMDTCMKILEVAGYDKQYKEEGYRLYGELLFAFRKASTVCREMNEKTYAI